MRESFCTNPSFFKLFLSWFVSLDLSHPWISAPSIAESVPAAVCFVNLARGGIECNLEGKEKVWWCKYARACDGNGDGGEMGVLSGAAKGIF
jgi:hypothetical protein